MRKRVRQREIEGGTHSGREYVCSYKLVCLVQNWFKAPGHRKKATLHSRHVPETSSRGSTIAIQQRQMQTPKWVCSVLQCPTWQSATYSTSIAPNALPLLLLLISHLIHPFSFSASFTQSHISTFNLCIFFSPTHAFLVCHLFFTFTVHHVPVLHSDLLSFYCKTQVRDADLIWSKNITRPSDVTFVTKIWSFHNNHTAVTTTGIEKVRKGALQVALLFKALLF